MTNESTAPQGNEDAAPSDRLGEGDVDLSRRNVLRAGAAGLAGATLATSGFTGSVAASDISTPRLQRDGNLIVDPDGNTVTLRGVNIADPKRLDVTAPARGMNAVQVIDFLTDHSNDWYPRAIRVPVQPVDIGEYEPGSGPPVPAFSQGELETYLTDHLDAVVQRCAERGVYCIIDYHRHRDVSWAESQDGPVNTALQDEIDSFWDTVAPRYADQTHVLYEVYNEPTEPGMWGDPTTTEWVADVWRLWLDMAQPWVDTIRSHADNMILMGSPSWTQSPEGALVEEFDGEDIAYTYHIYPGHNSSRANDWEDASRNGEGVAGVYEQAPLVVTEFGWEENAGQYIGGTTSGFGTPFIDWLESHDAISWTAWIGDPVWRPVMFDRPFTDSDDTDSIGNPYDGGVTQECSNLPCDWSLLTGNAHMGDTVKNTLYDLRNDNVPGSGGGDTTPPTMPSNLTVTDTTSTSITVDWDAASDGGGSGIDHYEIGVDGSADHEVAAGTTSTTVSGLAADTEYSIGVAAVDAAGNVSTTAMVSATTGESADQTAPTAPSNLSVTDATSSSIDVDWDAASDSGGSGLDHYTVSVDGTQEQTVPAGTTSATIAELSPDTSYAIGVSAVDGAGNESPDATVSATTDADSSPPSDALVINDYDGSPTWSSNRNDLGQWCGAGSFQNGDGEVVGGALELDYDNGGWFQEQINQDVSSYSTLVLAVSGANGGEGSEVLFDMGGVRTLLSNVTTDSVGTSTSEISIDLASAGVDRTASSLSLRLNFWQGGSSTLSIEEVRLE
ncbi:hypothetical protein GCM10028857_13960 [Salinarchaeum chitinilyticum]